MSNHAIGCSSSILPQTTHEYLSTNQENMMHNLTQVINIFFVKKYNATKVSLNGQIKVLLDDETEKQFLFEDVTSEDDILLQNTTIDRQVQTDLTTTSAGTQTDKQPNDHESAKVSKSTGKKNDINKENADANVNVDLSEIESDNDEQFVVLPAASPDSSDDKISSKKLKKESVSCPLCSANFRTQDKVENHLRVHHDIGNVYACSMCDTICPSNRALYEHLDEEHGEYVPKATSTPNSPGKKRGRKPSVRNVKKVLKGVPLKKSITANKNGKKKPKSGQKKIPTLRLRIKDDQYVREKFPCGECDKVYNSKKALNRHDRSAHKKVKYDCNICQKSFGSKESLHHHKKGIHAEDKPYSCEECGASFNFGHSLKLHMLKHSGKRPYQCNECDKTYLTANHLKMHMVGVHQNNTIHMCKFCSKSFAYKTSLKVHEMTHENIKPYKCQHCDKGFVNSHSLKYHVESKHEVDKWFTCDICQKEFKTEFSMKTHRRRHSLAGNRFMCDVCGRQFMYKSTLEIHSAIHKDEKTYQCSTCGKSFKTYATLYSHQYVHRTESPYPCPECGKPFKTKERCKAHQKRHAGTKSFTCDVCGNLFQDKGGLSKHIRTVHAQFKRFACPVCGKTCSRADNLRVHMKIHGKWTSNVEPIDTTASTESQIEKASISAIQQELSKQNKDEVNKEPSRPMIPVESLTPHENRNPSPNTDSYHSHPASREMSTSPTIAPLTSNRSYPDQQHFPNISLHSNMNVPLALTSMASSHMHPAENNDNIQSAHSGPVTQIPNPSPFMYMWPYINPHQNVPNPQEHEYYPQ